MSQPPTKKRKTSHRSVDQFQGITIPSLQAYLAYKSIEFEPNARRADLVDLLAKHNIVEQDIDKHFAAATTPFSVDEEASSSDVDVESEPSMLETLQVVQQELREANATIKALSSAKSDLETQLAAEKKSSANLTAKLSMQLASTASASNLSALSNQSLFNNLPQIPAHVTTAKADALLSGQSFQSDVISRAHDATKSSSAVSQPQQAFELMFCNITTALAALQKGKLEVAVNWLLHTRQMLEESCPHASNAAAAPPSLEVAAVKLVSYHNYKIGGLAAGPPPTPHPPHSHRLTTTYTCTRTHISTRAQYSHLHTTHTGPQEIYPSSVPSTQTPATTHPTRQQN